MRMIKFILGEFTTKVPITTVILGDGSYDGNDNDNVSDNEYPSTLEGEERDKRGDRKTIVMVEQISSLTTIIPQQYK